MEKKRDKETLLAQVEQAKQEYQQMCDVAENCYDQLGQAREQAIHVVEEAEELINSIKNTPHRFEKEVKDLRLKRKELLGKTELEKQQQSKNRAARAAFVAALGAGGVAVLTFKDYLSDMLSSSDDEDKKSAGLLFFVIGVIAYLIWRCWRVINNRIAVKRAAQAYKAARKETQELKKHIANIEQRTNELKEICAVVEHSLESLSKYKGWNFDRIPYDKQEDLITLVNQAETMCSKLS